LSKTFKALATASLLFSCLLFVRGLVLSNLWKWYLVPIGMPTINYVQALGIIYTVYACMPALDLLKNIHNVNMKKHQEITYHQTMSNRFINDIISSLILFAFTYGLTFLL
jgi:hypothetical protein